TEEARATLGELSSSVIEDGDLALDLAELALSADDAKTAMRWIETARRAAPELEADALHALGRAHEVAGDRPSMIAAWPEGRPLALAAPPGDVHVSEDEIERIASETLAELPQNIRDHLARVPILIDELPSEDIVADGFDPRLLGLFQGTPMPE